MATPSLSAAKSAPQIFDDLPPESVIFGTSSAMAAVRARVAKVAGTNIPVLVQGPSGSGKEVIARLLHRNSPWSSGPFVKVNCAAIPGTLLESELFGYEKGAFTGATTAKPGRAELANLGTLFLDEIGEIAMDLQAKLLQLLQDNRFWRIGGLEDIHVEVRAICATNRDLDHEIETGRFRQDLYYRINVARLELPSLRERSEDIPVFAEYFLRFYSRKYKLEARSISARIMRLMQGHAWPGNIRELANLMERYTILGTEESISDELRGVQTLRQKLLASTDGTQALKSVTRKTIQELERKMILDALAANRWNRKLAAAELKISYRALLYKIRDAGLPSRRTKRQDAEAGQ
jgi:two-component system, NtrC family, response regulator AtoC